MLPRLPIEGRLVAEPELRFSQAGNAVARLRLVASDRKHNDATGQWEDSDSLWIDVTAFGKLAENVCESVVKGDLVIVTGKLKTDEWQDKDSGQKRSKIVMIADAVGPSLAFRTTPHGAGRQTQQRVANPVTQAYPQETDPPF